MTNPFSFDTYNLLITFGISFLIQAIFFAFAATFKSDKVTDLSYSLTFILISLYLLFEKGELTFASLFLGIMVILWGLRLAAYLFGRILKIKKDKNIAN